MRVIRGAAQTLRDASVSRRDEHDRAVGATVRSGGAVLFETGQWKRVNGPTNAPPSAVPVSRPKDGAAITP